MMEQLLEVARAQGYLTYSEILEVFPQPELHVAEIDQVYAMLQADGLRVVESPSELEAAAPTPKTPNEEAGS